MPLPLTVSCFSKIQIGFTFLVPAHPGSLEQRAVKRVCVCVCVRVCKACWVNIVLWQQNSEFSFHPQTAEFGPTHIFYTDLRRWCALPVGVVGRQGPGVWQQRRRRRCADECGCRRTGCWTAALVAARTALRRYDLTQSRVRVILARIAQSHGRVLLTRFIYHHHHHHHGRLFRSCQTQLTQNTCNLLTNFVTYYT